MSDYIFQLGFNKSGTTSLTKALEILGYSVNQHSTKPDVERAIADGKAPLAYVAGGYDAYTDNWALSKHYKLLDDHYPKSKYVCLVRQHGDWLVSREKHVLRKQPPRENVKASRPHWTAEWCRYWPELLRYFQGRDDLLVMNICDGDGWELLCPFLDKPIPDEPFPHLNVATN